MSWPFLWQPESEGDGHAGLLLCILGRMGVEGVWSLSNTANVCLDCLARAKQWNPLKAPHCLLLFCASSPKQSTTIRPCHSSCAFLCNKRGLSSSFLVPFSMVIIRCLCWEIMLKKRLGFRLRMMAAGLVSWPGRTFGCFFLSFFFFYKLYLHGVFHWKYISGGFVIFMSWQGVFFIFNEQ